jgi:hypothetical protein
MHIRCRGDAFTEPLPRNGSTRYNTFRSHRDLLLHEAQIELLSILRKTKGSSQKKVAYWCNIH